MRVFLLALVAIRSVWCDCSCADPASNQLYKYKEETCEIPTLTTMNGAPVEARDTVGLNSCLMGNEPIMDMGPAALHERIPERVVHAKGTGAHGYFIVTNNITHCCKANFLSKIGKKTPVFVRFSQTSLDKGEPDSALDSRGFAIKFYTEEGVFDLVLFHTPMFTYKEPFMFQNIAKVLKRNPCTNLRDPNMVWDVITKRLECVNFFLYLFGKNGIPCTYRYLPGYSCHTYQVYNKHGKSCFVRFHITPEVKPKNLCTEKALKLMATDPDYAVRDLYNYIEKCKTDKKCKCPTWSVKLQVLTPKQIKEFKKFDPFDITKEISEKDYPLIEVGKLILNRNPCNHFAEVEQSAFCPGNLIPGILGAPDKSFMLRQFAYKDAQRYRLGINFQSLKVNRPHNPVYHYNRDGTGVCGCGGGCAPNYFQNTFNGPVPYVDDKRPALINITQFNRDDDNLQQPTELYEELDDASRDILAKNIVVFSLGKTCGKMQQRALELFERVHPDLAARVKKALAEAAAAAAAAEDEDICSCA